VLLACLAEHSGFGNAEVTALGRRVGSGQEGRVGSGIGLGLGLGIGLGVRLGVGFLGNEAEVDGRFVCTTTDYMHYY
jgi:hypothetical protein